MVLAILQQYQNCFVRSYIKIRGILWNPSKQKTASVQKRKNISCPPLGVKFTIRLRSSTRSQVSRYQGHPPARVPFRTRGYVFDSKVIELLKRRLGVRLLTMWMAAGHPEQDIEPSVIWASVPSSIQQAYGYHLWRTAANAGVKALGKMYCTP